MSRGLTQGEMKVLKAYVEHQNHESAAASLEISTQTLKNHLGSIYKKLEVKKAHAAVYQVARARGWDIFDGAEVAETASPRSKEAETGPQIT